MVAIVHQWQAVQMWLHPLVSLISSLDLLFVQNKINFIFSIGKYDAGLNEMPILPVKEKPSLRVVGDVGGKIAIIIDDMIDDVWRRSTFKLYTRN